MTSDSLNVFAVLYFAFLIFQTNLSIEFVGFFSLYILFFASFILFCLVNNSSRILSFSKLLVIVIINPFL